jgi:hypothetical protein
VGGVEDGATGSLVDAAALHAHQAVFHHVHQTHAVLGADLVEGFQESDGVEALKWLRTNLDWFNTHGVFLEKYNVVSPDKPPAKGVYPSQTGFGWTNAVFERFCKDYID